MRFVSIQYSKIRVRTPLWKFTAFPRTDFKGLGMEKGAMERRGRGGGQKGKGGLEGKLEQGRRLAKAGPGYRQ